jgi:gamma-glutamyltranspeptidase
VLCVVEPQSTGIGGDGFALIAPRGEAPPIGYNGSGRTPAALDPTGLGDPGLGRLAETDVHAVTVPGLVEALSRLLADHGTIPLAEALQPAIRYAEHGFPVHQRVADEWHGVTAKLSLSKAARAAYLPGGKAPAPGEVIRSPALAATLRRIAADGPRAFYEGEIAEAMADCLRACGGFHTPARLRHAQRQLRRSRQPPLPWRRRVADPPERAGGDGIAYAFHPRCPRVRQGGSARCPLPPPARRGDPPRLRGCATA